MKLLGDTVNAIDIFNGLQNERQLLRQFRALSEQQLLLLDAEDLAALKHLMDLRADLLLELRAIESTLKTWIDQIRTNPTISSEVLTQLRAINDEIVQIGNQIIDIDEQTDWWLELLAKENRINLECGD